MSLFPVIVQARAGDTFHIEAFWREVSSVVNPGPAPEIAELTATPLSEAVAAGKVHRRREKIALGLAAVAGIVGLSLLTFTGGWLLIVFAAVLVFYAVRPAPELEKFQQRHEAAFRRWQTAKGEWNARSGGALDFDAKRREIEGLRSQWAEIPNVRLKRLETLKNDQRRIQLERFLDGFEIDRARISGIGPGRKQTLESYGIETAADVERGKIEGIPGFGPKLQGNLLAWRHHVEAKFVFEPRRAIDPRDTARVEQEVLKHRQGVQDAMVKALAELKKISTRVIAARQQLRAHVEAAQKEYSQSLADYTAAKK